MQAGPYDNIKDIAMEILQKEVSTVPIIHSSSEDGYFPQLLHLASLSGILKCFAVGPGRVRDQKSNMSDTQMCLRSDSLAKVIERLANSGEADCYRGSCWQQACRQNMFI